MSRDDGFAVADVDSSYFDDAKMRDLWHALRDPDRMARAVCLHQATLLASWRAGCRVKITQAVPLWLAVDAELVTVLRAVKLLDRFDKIPSESWTTWFGMAYNRRESRRISGGIGGRVAAQRRGLPGEQPAPHHRKRAQQRSSDATATPEQTPSLAIPVRPSVPTVLSARPRARGDDNASPTKPTNDQDAVLPIPDGLPSEKEAARLMAEIRASLPAAQPTPPVAEAPADAPAESWFEPEGAP